MKNREKGNSTIMGAKRMNVNSFLRANYFSSFLYASMLIVSHSVELCRG